MNSETSEMENCVKYVSSCLECDYSTAAIICQGAILNDLAADISRIADNLESWLSEVAKSNLSRKEAA